MSSTALGVSATPREGHSPTNPFLFLVSRLNLPKALVGESSSGFAAFFIKISCGKGILSHSTDHTTFSLKASVMILFSSASTSGFWSAGQSSKVRATYSLSLSGNVVLELPAAPDGCGGGDVETCCA